MNANEAQIQAAGLAAYLVLLSNQYEIYGEGTPDVVTYPAFPPFNPMPSGAPAFPTNPTQAAANEISTICNIIDNLLKTPSFDPIVMSWIQSIESIVQAYPQIPYNFLMQGLPMPFDTYYGNSFEVPRIIFTLMNPYYSTNPNPEPLTIFGTLMLFASYAAYSNTSQDGKLLRTDPATNPLLLFLQSQGTWPVPNGDRYMAIWFAGFYQYILQTKAYGMDPTVLLYSLYQPAGGFFPIYDNGFLNTFVNDPDVSYQNWTLENVGFKTFSDFFKHYFPISYYFPLGCPSTD